MRDFLFRQPLTAALALLAIVLAAAIGFEIWSASSRTSFSGGPMKAASVDAKLLPPLPESSAEQAYPETGARPLFTPTRRPAPPREATGTMPKGQYVLQGVTIVGDLRVAMLRDKSAGRIYRIEKGGDLNGTTVSAIEPERVTLKQGDDTEVLELTVQKGGNTGAAAPATAGATAPQPGLGPFAAPGAAAAAADRAAAAAAAGGAPLVPGMPPAGSGGQVPMMPQRPGTGGPMPAVPQPGSPATSAPPPATTQAVTPEELLARRRAARRAQQQAQ